MLVYGRTGGTNGCEIASYRRLIALGMPPAAGKNPIDRRVAALCKDGCYVRSPKDLAALSFKALGPSEIQKREHLFFALVDHRELVWFLGVFSSKQEHMCAFKFQDMVPDLEATLFAMDRGIAPSAPWLSNLPAGTPRRHPGGLFMIHNHPSGHAAFSDEDIAATDHIAKMHEGLPFGLVDSLVVTRGGAFVSLLSEQERVAQKGYRDALAKIPFRSLLRREIERIVGTP